MVDSVRIDGLDEVRRALMDTPVELRKKVIYRLLRKAAQPMLRAARAGAPRASKASRRVIPGLLQRSIGIRVSKIKRPAAGEFGVFITATTPPGVKRIKRAARKVGGAGPNFGDPFYHKFQEAGFHAVGRRSSASRLKASGARFIPGKKYLGSAYESHKMGFVETFRVDVVQAAVEAFNKRAKR